MSGSSRTAAEFNRLGAAYGNDASRLLALRDWAMELERDLARLTAESEACKPFLKDGETPAECIERNRADANMMLGFLANERAKVEALRKERDRLLRGEFICQRCGLRKDSERNTYCGF